MTYAVASNGAGEITSAVLPPGSPTCPGGRILIVNDSAVYGPVGKPGTATGGPSYVWYWDLGEPGNGPHESIFSGPPDLIDYLFCTNDNDIVALDNGDVLFTVGMGFKDQRPDVGQPVWWNKAFRYGFGPGARAGVAVWRSRDGGETFLYERRFDPLDPVLFPDPRFAAAAPHGTAFDMGGSDGQVVRTFGNRVFVVFGANNTYVQDPSKSEADGYAPTALGAAARLFVSDDYGHSWKAIGTIEQWSWRMAVQPLPADDDAASTIYLIAGGSSALFEVRQSKAGEWSVAPVPTNSEAPAGQPLPRPTVSATNLLASRGIKAGITDSACACVLDSPTNGAVPVLVTTTPSALSSDPTHPANGFDVRVWNPYAGGYTVRRTSIKPQNTSAAGAIMHVTAVDAADYDQPVLLYWYDVDTHHVTASGEVVTRVDVRSRLLWLDHSGEDSSLDTFDIRHDRQLPWMHCTKCAALFFGGDPSTLAPNSTPTWGRCPNTSDGHPGHAVQRQGGYAVDLASGDTEWRWCRKCLGMFWSATGASDSCPAGGGHDSTGSSQYSFPAATTPDVQQGWSRCAKCSVLYFPGNGVGSCPAGDGHEKIGTPVGVITVTDNWYGDYHTARGYTDGDLPTYRSHYFPVWVHKDLGGSSEIRFTEVTYPAVQPVPGPPPSPDPNPPQPPPPPPVGVTTCGELGKWLDAARRAGPLDDTYEALLAAYQTNCPVHTPPTKRVELE